MDAGTAIVTQFRAQLMQGPGGYCGSGTSFSATWMVFSQFPNFSGLFWVFQKAQPKVGRGFRKLRGHWVWGQTSEKSGTLPHFHAKPSNIYSRWRKDCAVLLLILTHSWKSSVKLRWQVCNIKHWPVETKDTPQLCQISMGKNGCHRNWTRPITNPTVGAQNCAVSCQHPA